MLSRKNFYILVLFCVLTSAAFGQTKKIDSLTKATEKLKKSEDKISNYLKLFSLQTHYNPHLALTYIDEAKKLSNLLDNDSITFEVYRKYINHYFLNQNHDLTLKYIDTALTYKDNISPEKHVKLHRTLGQSSVFIEDFETAISSFKECLKLSETHDLLSQKIVSFNSLAQTYLLKKDLKEATTNINKAISLCRDNGLKTSELNNTLIFGHISYEKENYSTALKIYKGIEQGLRENKNRILEHSLNTALGRVYKKLKLYDDAIIYLNKNLEFNAVIQNDIGINSIRTDIAHVLKAQQKYDESINLLKTNLLHAKELNNSNLVRQNYLDLSETYEEIGRFKNALVNRKEYQKWNDSILNETNQKTLNELEIKYETEKKEKDILQLSQTKMKNEAAIAQQSKWIKRLGYGFLAFAVLSLAGFIIFKQRSENKKQKELITVITNTQIAEQKRIAQDLHDSIGGSLALTKTKLTSLLNPLKEDSKEAIELINTLDKTSEEVRQISYNMMPGELLKFGLVSAVQSTLDKLKSESLEVNLYSNNITKRIDQKKEIQTFRIIQEIIQNVLKHAEASVLNIYLNRHAKSLNLMVEDNGKGFEKATQGLGLSGIKTRVKNMKGKLQIDSALGRGTTYNIEIPLA